jgi:hypothetical protein
MLYAVEIKGAYDGFPNVLSDYSLEADLSNLVRKYTGRYYSIECTEQDRDDRTIGYLIEVPWRMDDRDWLGCSAMGDLLIKAIGMQGEEVNMITVEFYEED